MYYALAVGIEHLMTGVQMVPRDINSTEHQVFQFTRESASTVKVMSEYPFSAYWQSGDIWLDAVEIGGDMPQVKATRGQIEWYAQVLGEAMRKASQKSYDMAGYTTPLHQRLDWPRFTDAIIDSMRTKFGKDADEWLGKLKWAHDHWYFEKDGMYHGVEPDGYIHT